MAESPRSPDDSASDDDVVVVVDLKRRREASETAEDGGDVPPPGAVAGARHRPSAQKLDSARFEIAKSEIVKTVVTRKQHGRSKRVPWTAGETEELERLHRYFKERGDKSTLALPVRVTGGTGADPLPPVPQIFCGQRSFTPGGTHSRRTHARTST